MANFNRSDLKFTYSWSADGGDNPKLRGAPDDSLLDRTEGYEVLYIIQKIMEANAWVQVVTGQKIERMIKSHSPSTIRTQAGIKAWINQNWNSYS